MQRCRARCRRSAEMQRCTDAYSDVQVVCKWCAAGVQVCRFAGFYVCRCRSTEVQKCRGREEQRCRGADFERFRVWEVQRSAEVSTEVVQMC